LSSDSVLREKARALIHSGEFPDRTPDGLWGGPGTGAECAVCKTTILPSDNEMELEFVQEPTRARLSFFLHLRCFTMLELERSRRSTEVDHAHQRKRAGTGTGP
jgi:hypothetical protein